MFTSGIPVNGKTTSRTIELHLSVKTEDSPTLDFWHTSIGVVYSNCTLGVKDAIELILPVSTGLDSTVKNYRDLEVVFSWLI
jgi:hypothetical protein